MKKVTLISLILIIFSCKNTGKKTTLEYYSGTNVIKIEKVFPNQNDTTTYSIIEYYKIGDTCSISLYKKNILVGRHYWLESKTKVIEEEITKITEKTVFGKDSSGDYEVTADQYIGKFKHWNKKGILIYETHLLSNRKEQRITRDSIGNVLKIDTIAY